MALPQFTINAQNVELSATHASTGLYRLTITLTPKTGFLLDISDQSKYIFTYYNTNTRTDAQNTIYRFTETEIQLRANYFSSVNTPVVDLSNVPDAISATPQAEIINNVSKSDLQTEQDGNNFSFVLSVGANVIDREKQRFEIEPSVTYTDLDGLELVNNFSAVSDFVEYSVNISNVDISKPITINGKISKLLELRETLTNANLTSVSPDMVFADSVVNVQLKANENFYFAETPYLRISGTAHDFTLIDNYTAEISLDFSTISIPDNVDYFTILATAEIEVIPPKIVNIHENLTNSIVSSVSPETIYDDSIFTIIVNANDGYYFDQTPKIEITYFGGSQEIEFVLLDNYTAKIIVNLPELGLIDVTDIYINAFAEVETTYERNYGAINVYHVDTDNLKDWAEKRFFTFLDSTNVLNYIDLGKYVISLKRVFIPVGAEIETPLCCGNYNTEINVKTPVNDLVNINFGEIVLPNYNNDIADFQSEINIFLPFVGFRNIPNEFITKSINLQYDINIISGVGYAKLFVDGIMFDSYECNICADVIYKSAETLLQNTTIGTPNFRTPQLNGLQPYIIYKWFTTANEHIYNNNSKREVIANISGFAKLEEVTNFISDSITKSEKDLLFSLLADGVIILH